MPTLMLLRHGKSSWDEPGLADRDRPLNARGRRDAETMAAVIAQDHWPDRILCSPALRTRQTLAALIPHLADESIIAITDRLYEAGGEDYRHVIVAEGGDSQRLLVIGHNPAIEETASILIGSGDKALRGQLAAKFPTAALAVIAFDGDWRGLRPKSGRLVTFLRPRDLGPD